MKIIFRGGHVAALDGLRGIAILLVIFFHCFEDVKKFPLSVISGIGWIGVDVFFVLSGFLITGILIDSKGRKNYFSSFITKRALRIFPLYYFALLVVYITISIPQIRNSNTIFDIKHFDSIWYYITFTQNIFFSYNGWGVTDLLNHFWSLAVEEQFYLFWPIIIYFFEYKKVVYICVVLVITGIVIRNFNADSDYSYVFTLARTDALAIGAMTAIAVRKYTDRLNKITLQIFLCVFSWLVILLFLSPNITFRNPYFVRGGYTIFALLCSTIILFIFDKGRLGKVTNSVLSLHIFTFFGKYSYGLYVYHWLLYKGVYLFLVGKYHFPKYYILFFLVFVVIVSVVSFHTLESFFLKFKVKYNPQYRDPESVTLVQQPKD